MKILIYIWIILFSDSYTLGSYPSNSSLKGDEEKITEFLRSEFGDKSEFPRKFIYDLSDLNNDGKAEYLVGLIGPEFCGTGGCTILVLSHDLKLISRVTIVKYPVYLGENSTEDTTKGYKNIYLRTGEVGFVKLVWDGKSYPGNPSMQPKIPESVISGKFKYLHAEDAPFFEF